MQLCCLIGLESIKLLSIGWARFDIKIIRSSTQTKTCVFWFSEVYNAAGLSAIYPNGMSWRVI